jgi:glycosyltransferase involved in cell wall biosynthesis
MSHRVLMVAFHYPPCSGSSGLQRTLAFSRYLPAHGWEPALLTAKESAYETTAASLMGSVPPGMPIRRARALDAARHLSLAGRYPMRLATPDRWVTWKWWAVPAGLKLIREFRPDVIWSTFPIATAHAIAAQLHRRTGIPWVADMRDPMVEHDPVTGIDYPTNPGIRRERLTIEREVIDGASRVVFCTPGARAIGIARYGEAHANRFAIVPNGYDEDTFAQVEREPRPARQPGQFRLVHSGTVYPGTDRGPDALFAALAALRSEGALPAGFRLVLRASGHDAQIMQLAQKENVADLIDLAPSLPYRQAIAEMFESEGLLLLQGRTSNPAIPAKLYEYLRVRRPILALVHPDGDTAAFVRESRSAITAPLDAPAEIATALREFFRACASDRAPMATADTIAAYSRASQTRDLAAVFDDVIR